MDPINGVLDETFFKVASPECLAVLSKLTDDALVVCLTNYLNSITVDNSTAATINNYLGRAIRMATFHMQLSEYRSAKMVEKIELETIANMRFDQRAVTEELGSLEKSIGYVRSLLEPRRKADYGAFVALLPAGYKIKVANNRVMFYQPHAKMRSAGVGVISRKHNVWTIALKGLKYREYITRFGCTMDSYMVKGL